MKTPEMIFPPVNATKMCLRFTVCVRVRVFVRRPHAKGFHGQRPRVLAGGGVPWAVIAFPALTSQTHTFCGSNTIYSSEMEDTHTRTHAHRANSHSYNEDELL